MSRITKWKLEKTKVKVVFRLQFHATHIPQSGWDKLFISFIPTDSGKATTKTTKANVRNGTCKWGDPIYETTRLLQDVKTKQYDEKLYKLVIAMGSSRSSILGEVIINLADYADASKPAVVALPLHGCDSGTILHVTVQLLTSKTGFREFEQQRELRERGLQIEQNSPDESTGRKVSSSVETVGVHMDKVNTRVRFKEKSKDLVSLEEEVGPNEEYSDSAVGFDGSSNTSESLYAEKHEISSTHEIDSIRSTASGDLAGLSLNQSPQLEKADASDHRFSVQGTNDWVQGWSSDYSVDNDLAAVYEENNRLKESLEVAESSIHELKSEVSLLQSHADEIGHEAQQFAKQLAAEIVSGEEMVKEVSVLKSECSKLKDDLEQVKVSKLCPQFSGSETTGAEQHHIFQDLQFKWLKGLLALEDNVRDLQNKACFGYNERELRFLHSDVEALLGILQNLKQVSGLAGSSLNMVSSGGASLKEIKETSSHKNGQFATGTGFDVDLYQPELGMLHCLNIPGLVSHESDAVDTISAMKSKIFELLRELEESKTERGCIAKKMDEMECYYEALVQELEENQSRMLLELQNLRNEHSTCLYTISSTKAEMESMRQELNDQMLRLAKDKNDVDSLNKELERRAITAEAALKRARLNYSIAVDQLQKDLGLLSFQVLSMHETNENLIRQTFADSSQPRIQGFYSREYTTRLLQFQSHSVGISKQQLGGEDILLDDLKRSLHLQEGLYRKVEEEVNEMHFVNIYLDVLSKALHETLLGANEDIKLMREKVKDLMQQLEFSAESKELMMQKLQTAMDDLNGCKATHVAKCNELALQNQTLEANLQDVTRENHLLHMKIAEWECEVRQCRGYESKYEACFAEKSELACLFEKKAQENGSLQNENVSLQDELKSLKTEFDKQASQKESLQKFVDFLQDKLKNLLTSYSKSVNGLLPLGESDSQDLQSRDLTGVLMQLEELQYNACEKILKLVEDKKCLMDERDVAKESITAAESEIALMKQKFEHEIRSLLDKLDMSSVLLHKIQLDIEVFADRLKVSSEVEEKYAQQQTELFSDLDRIEVGLQQLTSENKNLAHEILSLETVTAAEFTKENHALVASLQDKNEECTRLALELKSLKEILHSLHDENKALIESSRVKMEDSVHLASELSNIKGSLESLHEENQVLMASSLDKAAEAARLASELNSLKANLQFLHNENQVLMASSLDKTEVSAKLKSEIDILKQQLQSLCCEKEALVVSLEESAKLASELNLLKESLQFLRDQNQALKASLQGKTEESAKLALELGNLKESFLSLHDEKQALIASSLDKNEESANLVFELNHLKESVQSLYDEKQALVASSEEKTEENDKLASEVNSLKDNLQTLHNENQVLVACLWDKSEESAKLKSEVSSLIESLQSLHNEKQALMISSQDKTDESARLALELKSLRESLRSLHDQLRAERSLTESLESKITDLTSQLNEKESHILHLRKSVSDLESEKSRVRNLLSHYEDSLKIAREECSSVYGLETELCEMHELLMDADVRLVFTKTQYEGMAEELVLQCCSSDRHLDELQKKHIDVETTLTRCLASEAQYIEENAKLLTSLSSIRSEIEAYMAENRLLLEANRIKTAELEEYKHRAQHMELSYCENKSQHSLEVERLKQKLLSSEEEIDNLVFSTAELEVKALVLKAKLDEQQAHVIAMEGYPDELMMLKKQYTELTQRLAEQSLKAEEFRNLSVHLKELKDKADADRIQAHEKRELEVPPVAMQESLRIAFIKEQYETRLQELKHQLSISKQHSEEMLWKLQDAIDEIENRKKSEACHLKKNEELGMKILELETDLQSVLTEKRERMNTYDLMKAEMECSLISLECCKEEKQKLEVSLHECIEEKSKLAVELSQIKEVLENSKLRMNIQEEGNGVSCKVDSMSTDESIFKNVYEENSFADALSYGRRSVDVTARDPFLKCLEQDSLRNCKEVDQVTTPTNVQLEQDIPASTGTNGIQSSKLLNQQKLLHSDMKNLALINNHFRAESLKSSMDHLNNELERMKNENSLLQDDHDFYQKFPGLQREFMQLQKANEELGSMFPLFNEFSGSGNALERVLALEIELAESLQAKKRSSISFQSSFLKQHSDEEAVFKSFRDINELIQDMLELKGKYTAVETELKEMHDRYSQLSLQFAEVEGERQKLMMTLKTVRASKKALHLNWSSSALLGDHSL